MAENTSEDYLVGATAAPDMGQDDHLIRDHDAELDPNITRRRVMTEKGQQYVQQIKNDRLLKLFKFLDKKANELDNLMEAHASTTEVHDLFSPWIGAFDEFKEVFQQCFNSLEIDYLEPILKWVTAKDQLLFDFKEKVSAWLCRSQVKSEHRFHAKSEIRPEDSASQTSRRSGRSSRASLMSAKLREQQRQVELEMKMATFKKKREIEQSKLRLQQEELQLKLETEQLELDEELAICEAKRKVIHSFERSREDVTQLSQTVPKSRVSDVVAPAPRVRSTMRENATTVLNPRAESFIPPKPASVAYPSPVVSHQSLLAAPERPESVHYTTPTYPVSTHYASPPALTPSSDEVIMSVVRQLKKPATDIQKFDGNPLQYKKFMRQFKTKILINSDDDDERMNFLEQYTTGEAHKIVSGLGYLDASQGYSAALAELEERYGDPDIIVNAYINKALSWPFLKPANAKGLDEYAIFLSECQNAVQSVEATKILEYSENFKRLVGKLPFHLHDKWRNLVLNLKDCRKTVKFSDLVNFVRKEAKKANDPVFGRDAMNIDQKDGEKKKPSASSKNKSASFATSATETVKKPSQKQSLSSEKVSMYTESKSSSTNGDNGKPKSVKGSTFISNPDKAFKSPCLHCNNKQHSLDKCETFCNLAFSDRIDVLKSIGLCFGCLKAGHIKQFCKVKVQCTYCSGRHHSVSHINRSTEKPEKDETAAVEETEATQQKQPKPASALSVENAGTCMGVGQGECTFAIVPVKVRMRNSIHTVSTYAFLDTGSNVSFCTESLMECLGAHGKPKKITIDTMGVPHTMTTYAVQGLEVSDLQNENSVNIDTVYTKKKIPASSKHIPNERDIGQWPHLTKVSLPQISADVELLIGNNIPDAYSPLEILTGPSGSPHATRSRLGWIVWNLVRDDNSSHLTVARTEMSAIESTEEDQRMDQMIQTMINLDFPEKDINDKRENSIEDKLFMSKVNSTIKKVNGHYEIGLPFKSNNIALPNNEKQALHRLISLKKKFQQNEKFKADYVTFMPTIIDKGYAEEVPDQEVDQHSSNVWYILHHGVYHPRKPNKIRVVFDCAASYQGISLNKLLLQGPDLTNNLLGVLMKFREEPIAVMADIEAMFYQVLIPMSDTDCLRFYWWPHGDMKEDPKVYRMLVHLFGATYSPTCCNVALRRTAEDNHDQFPAAVCDVVRENFYVDDLLKSISKEEDAISLIQDVTALCKQGGFHLTKWISNSRVVLESVAEKERAKELKEVNLDKSELPATHALGVTWYAVTDTFGFKVVIRDLLPNRRNLLSVISSVFDPLGLLSPFTLIAKVLLQELCRQGITWDDVISENDQKVWKRWLEDVKKIENFSVPRCLKPADFGRIISVQIHHFSDASESAYGVVSYIRLENENGQIHCALLLSKARVNPLKKKTIPRLELTAAALAVRLNVMIQNHLSWEVNYVFYWTDSMAVLRYIWNETTRFHTFVANRVTTIREGSNIENWKFVSSELNPADDVSRGLTIDKLLESERWLAEPEFLWSDQDQWPDQPASRKLPSDDPEVKAKSNAAVQKESNEVLDHLLTYFSDWLALKKTVAWLMVAKRRLIAWAQHRKELHEESTETDPIKKREKVEVKMKEVKLTAMKQSKKDLASTHLTIPMVEEAETLICKYEQRRCFAEEIANLENTSEAKNLKRSPLYKLDPIIQDGVLRVGGRLDRAPIPHEAKHPIIIPAESLVSTLVLRHVHEQLGHLGKNAILAEVQQKFWILRASNIIKNIVSKCVVCRRYTAKRMDQKMSDLPAVRTTSDEPPFSRVGMDYFGPIEVKRGRSTVKRYGVLFTCMTMRAVHLELASSLDTDSCINAIRRFIARRGQVKSILSDNGTNLVGAEKELRTELSTWNESAIHSAMLQKNIDWRFNPPAASHFGGVWERLIRSVRKVLYSLMQKQTVQLDDESLRTFFAKLKLY